MAHYVVCPQKKIISRFFKISGALIVIKLEKNFPGLQFITVIRIVPQFKSPDNTFKGGGFGGTNNIKRKK
jgi:hypothetical protein